MGDEARRLQRWHSNGVASEFTLKQRQGNVGVELGDAEYRFSTNELSEPRPSDGARRGKLVLRTAPADRTSGPIEDRGGDFALELSGKLHLS